MNLVIAEKPSVAQSIAKVIGADKKKDGYIEGNDYVVSWCVGHLVELAEPDQYDEKYGRWRKEDLPIFPGTSDMQWKYQVSPTTKKQYEILSSLMRRDDIDCVTNACDAGREGELIFRLVYDMCKCKKTIKRLWISSMEDEAIEEGFANLKNGIEYESLYDAALCRERADWIVGINATRLFSTLYGQTLNVGRVMTPTLALIVEREANIRSFKSKDFYTVVLNCDGVELTSERIEDKEKAEILEGECKLAGKVLVVDSAKKEKKQKAPLLFDLTSLQREANRRFGYTSQQTLDYAQNLYEKKILSYPRTDSRYLTEDMEKTIKDIAMKAEQISGCKMTSEINTGVVVNGKKVTDHHAVIPTSYAGKVALDELPTGEREILKLVSLRLLEAISSPCTYEETEIDAECMGNIFKAKGKKIIDAGWKSVEKDIIVDEEEDDNQEVTANINAGEKLNILSTMIKDGKTSPPKSFTEDTLLSAMEKAGADETPDEAERKGLGTPATRAGVIEKLVRIGFIERKGDKKTKYLIPTHKGEALITVIPEVIQSASMTSEWEQKLLEIEKREYEPEIFIDEIQNLIKELIDTYEVIQDAEVLMHPAYESVGKCPVCGNDVIEKSKGFFCNEQECKFAIWKENRLFESMGKKMSKQIAEKLLKNGSAKLKKCKSSKSDKTYDCTIVMTVNDKCQASYKLEFENKVKGAK